MRRRPFDLRLLPLALLTVLLGLGAVLVYRAPVHRYVVTCARHDGDAAAVCALEQVRSSGAQRWQVPLGPGAQAVVRVLAQRRGPARTLLYLEASDDGGGGSRAAVFAAEFEGADASATAASAAAQLNAVLLQPHPDPATAVAPPPSSSPPSSPAEVRIETVAPATLRWAAWAGLGVMALLLAAMYRHVVRQPDASAA